MATSIFSQDGGAVVAKKLCNPHQVLPANKTFTGITGVYVMWVDKRLMGPQCSSFDTFDKTNPHSVAISALLQLLFRSLTEVGVNYNTKGVGKVAGAGVDYPVEVLLECVLESEEEAKKHNLQSTESGLFENILEAVYGIDVKGGYLNRLEKESQPAHENLPFMRGYRNRRVLGYRFWIFVKHAIIDFPGVVNYVMGLANKEYINRTSSTTLLADNKVRKEYLKALAQTGTARDGSIAADVAAGGNFSMAHIVTAQEQWVLVHSRQIYLNMIAVLLCDRRYLTPAVRNQAAASELSSNSNPAFIGGVFGPHTLFERVIDGVEPLQMQMQNYFRPSGHLLRDGTAANQDTWLFPIDSVVLPILAEDQTIDTLQRYLPDYQVEHIYRRMTVADLDYVQSQMIDNPGGQRAHDEKSGKSGGTGSSSTAAGAHVGDKRPADAPLSREFVYDNVFATSEGNDDNDASLVVNEFDMYRNPFKRPRSIVAPDHSRRENDSDTDDEAIAQGGDPFKRNEQMVLQEANARAANTEVDGDERSKAVIVVAKDRFPAPAFKYEKTISQQDEARFSDVVLSQNNIIPPAVLAQQKKIDEGLNGQYAGNSAIDVLARSTRAELEECQKIGDVQKRQCLRATIVNRVFKRYRDTAMSPLSNISEVGQTLNAFAISAKTHGEDHWVEARHFDPKLSSYAHMEIQDNIEADVLTGAHSNHRQLKIMRAAHLDCYRPTFNFHINLICYSAPGRGKSFAALAHEERCVPNTIKNISRLTARALCSGKDVIDECHLFHEIPRDLLCDPMLTSASTSNARGGGGAGGGGGGGGGGGRGNGIGGDQSQIDLFKTRLTEHVIITQEPVKIDGQFVTVERKSVMHTTIIGCTNVPVGMMAAAIRSRVIALEFNEVRRRDASMTDKEIARRGMTRATMLQKKRYIWEQRMYQVYSYHLDKLIAIGAIPDVDLTVFDIYAPVFLRTLEECGIRVPIRDMTKLELTIRHAAMRYAHYQLYKAPGAIFAGKPFDIDQLKHVSPRLFANQEMALFAMKFLEDQYVDSNRQLVIKAIRELVSTRADTPFLFERFRRGVGGSTTFNRQGGNPTVAGAGRQNRSDVQQGTLPGRGRGAGLVGGGGGGTGRADFTGGYGSFGDGNAAANTPPVSWADVTPTDVRFDFGRVMIRSSLAQFTIEIEAIVNNMPGHRLDREQISRLIVLMTNDVIMSYPFLPNVRYDPKQPLSEQNCPVYEDKTAKKFPSPMVEFGNFDSIITIHSLPTFLSAPDPIDLVIKRCADQFTSKRKVLTGAPAAFDLPHLYMTRVIEPNPNVIHSFSSVSEPSMAEMAMLGKDSIDPIADTLAEDRFKEVQSARKVSLMMPIDEYAATKRMDQVDLPQDAAALFSVALFDHQIKTDPKNFVRKSLQFSYPEGMTAKRSITEELNEISEAYANCTLAQAREKLKGRVVEVCWRYNADEASKKIADQVLRRFKISVTPDQAYGQLLQFQEQERQRKKREEELAALKNVFINKHTGDGAESLAAMKKQYEEEGRANRREIRQLQEVIDGNNRARAQSTVDDDGDGAGDEGLFDEIAEGDQDDADGCLGDGVLEEIDFNGTKAEDVDDGDYNDGVDADIDEDNVDPGRSYDDDDDDIDDKTPSRPQSSSLLTQESLKQLQSKMAANNSQNFGISAADAYYEEQTL